MTKPTETGARRAAPCELLRAREMSDFSLDHRVDVRGWRVYASDAELVGSVESLFVDIHTKAIRYLGVALDDPQSKVPIGTVLVPIGMAARPGDWRVVVIRALSSKQLVMAPRVFSRPVTRADEDSVLSAYGMATSRDVRAADFYTRLAFAEQRLFGNGAPAAAPN